MVGVSLRSAAYLRGATVESMTPDVLARLRGVPHVAHNTILWAVLASCTLHTAEVAEELSVLRTVAGCLRGPAQKLAGSTLDRRTAKGSGAEQGQDAMSVPPERW